MDKTQKAVLEGHKASVESVAVSENYKYIVSGSSDNMIRVWNFLKIRKVLKFDNF